MYRWIWKVRRTYRNLKRLALLFIIAGVFLSFQKQNIGQWLNAGLKIAVVAVFLYFGFKMIRWYLKQSKMKWANINEIDRMSGEEFEHYLGYVFSRLGYRTKVTPLCGDHGADLVLKKDGITTVVQAKRYRNKVDNKAIQEIVASMKMYGADKAMVVTNSVFTGPAVQLARANDVELWDRNRLINELARINVKKEMQFRQKVI